MVHGVTGWGIFWLSQLYHIPGFQAIEDGDDTVAIHGRISSTHQDPGGDRRVDLIDYLGETRKDYARYWILKLDLGNGDRYEVLILLEYYVSEYKSMLVVVI